MCSKTIGMPPLAREARLGAQGLRGLAPCILGFIGTGPDRISPGTGHQDGWASGDELK